MVSTHSQGANYESTYNVSSLPRANNKHALGGLNNGHLALSDGLRPPEVVVYDGLQGQLPVG